MNVYGKHLLQLCKNSGMIISNGRFFMMNAPEILHTSLEEAKALSIIYYCQNVVSTCYGILKLDNY